MIPKQPATGIAATILCMAISLAFISLWDFPTFDGWVSFSLLCIIPMEIIVGVIWGTNHPGFAQRAQPMKGILLAVWVMLAGAVIGPVYHAVAGGGFSPPAPMLIQCTIVSVVVTFWWAIMMGGWPITAVIKNPMGAGLTLWAACYGLNYLLFRVLFNYAAMKGAPVYVASLDPQGMFDADHILVFYLAFIGIMFLMLHFDLWPFSLSPGLMKQPVLGLVWTALAFVLGGAIYYTGVYVLGTDVTQFMVRVPVPFIFGTIVVLNMCQNSFFPDLRQPLKGAANAASALVIGNVLAGLYRILMPTVTGPLPEGPPGYSAEHWLASALLGVTFPLLVMHADFFKFWPLRKSD